MTRDEMVALTTHWRNALEKRNLGAYTLLYASDAAVESPLGGVVNTPERLRKAFELFFATFPDATFTFEVPCIDNTRAVLVAMMAGTHVGEISGLPASGKPFRLQIVFVLDRPMSATPSSKPLPETAPYTNWLPSGENATVTAGPLKGNHRPG